MVKRLVEIPGRPKIPRKVNEYTILQQIPNVGTARSFLAKHSGGDERVLRLIEKPALLQEGDQSWTALVREYEALRALGETGRVPAVDPYIGWEDGDFFVIPLHPLGGESLRANRLTGPPDADLALRVVRDAFQGLRAIHQKGIKHRALGPDRVHLRGPDSDVCFSDFLIAQMENEDTVAPFVDTIDPPDAYRAPEVPSAPVARRERERRVQPCLVASLLDHGSGAG